MRIMINLRKPLGQRKAQNSQYTPETGGGKPGKVETSAGVGIKGVTYLIPTGCAASYEPVAGVAAIFASVCSISLSACCSLSSPAPEKPRRIFPSGSIT